MKYIYKLSEYILMFMVAAFVGWLYEITCVYFIYGEYYDRGVLHLPFCPIYAFGAYIIYFLFRKIKHGWLIFILSVFVTTSIELIVSYIAEYKFNMILWTYEGWPLNYQNRISIVSSLIFGVMSVTFIKGLKPLVTRIYGTKLQKYIALIVIILFGFCAFWETRFC